MPEYEGRADDQISLFAIGTTLLRHRWRIARWILIGGVLAILTVLTKPKLYRASASFAPQGQTDASRPGLAGLASQFGVSLPTGNQSMSPDFYAMLLKSRVLLRPITHDTIAVSELGGKRATILDLYEIEGATPALREDRGADLLSKTVAVAVVKTTGVVELAVATPWPSVSLAVANALIDGVNDYNKRTRQSQASAERKFIDGRLAVAGSELRAAEDRLENFLRTNRTIGNSPELTFQRERLQRDVSFQQQLFTSLTQSYEESRIREVRDTPVITVVETPSVNTLPEARGRLLRVLLGLFLGGLVGVLFAFMSGLLSQRRREGDLYADEFASTLGELKSGMVGRVRRFRRSSST